MEIEDRLHIGVYLHCGQGTWLSCKLQPCLLQVVEVEVSVARSMNEFATLQARHLRHHLQQQSIGSNIKRHAKESVCRPLVELQRQLAIGYVKLKKAMAGRQRHLVDVSRIPSRDNHPAGVGIVLYHIHHLGYLVDSTPFIIGPRAPLRTIEWPKLAIFVSPLVPDSHAIFLQELHVGVARKEPEKLVDDGFQMELLRGEQGETLAHRETHLMPKNA